jgi:formate dehydrogenase subunit gamma
MTELASALIAEQKDVPGALLPTLHALQNEFGYIDDAAVPLVAEALNLSQAEVHGVVSFYHDFRRVPAGRRVLKICRAEACQSMGGEALASYYKTNPDGSLTVEAVYCLGNCALAPAAMLDGELLGRVTREKLDGLLLQNEATARYEPPFSPPYKTNPGRDGASTFRATRRRFRWARTQWPIQFEPNPRSKWCGRARAECSGWSLW